MGQSLHATRAPLLLHCYRYEALPLDGMRVVPTLLFDLCPVTAKFLTANQSANDGVEVVVRPRAPRTVKGQPALKIAVESVLQLASEATGVVGGSQTFLASAAEALFGGGVQSPAMFLVRVESKAEYGLAADLYVKLIGFVKTLASKCPSHVHLAARVLRQLHASDDPRSFGTCKVHIISRTHATNNKR